MSGRGLLWIYSAKKKYKGTKYRIETTYQDGTTVVTADAYAFDSQITEFDTYLLQRASTMMSTKSLVRIR